MAKSRFKNLQGVQVLWILTNDCKFCHYAYRYMQRLFSIKNKQLIKGLAKKNIVIIVGVIFFLLVIIIAVITIKIAHESQDKGMQPYQGQSSPGGNQTQGSLLPKV